jgi:hypothetical protein
MDLAEYVNRELIQELPESTLLGDGTKSENAPLTLQIDEPSITITGDNIMDAEYHDFVPSTSFTIDDEDIVSLAPAGSSVVPIEKEQSLNLFSISAPLVLPSALYGIGAATTSDDIVDEIIFTFRPVATTERQSEGIPFSL